jgi:Histidine kinase-, DNA gyrase B-, and HSP90-like ATPase
MAPAPSPVFSEALRATRRRWRSGVWRRRPIGRWRPGRARDLASCGECPELAGARSRGAPPRRGHDRHPAVSIAVATVWGQPTSRSRDRSKEGSLAARCSSLHSARPSNRSIPPGLEPIAVSSAAPLAHPLRYATGTNEPSSGSWRAHPMLGRVAPGLRRLGCDRRGDHPINMGRCARRHPRFSAPDRRRTPGSSRSRSIRPIPTGRVNDARLPSHRLRPRAPGRPQLTPTATRPPMTRRGAIGLRRPDRERASRHSLEIDSSLDLAFEQGYEPTRHTPELETLIYRIIQESLTNATKHGHPTRAVIETRENASTIELSVRDDGEAFDPESRTAGFGSLVMRERAQLPHGTIPGQRHHHRCEPPRTAPPGRANPRPTDSHLYTRRGRRDHRARAPHDLPPRSHRRPLVRHVTLPAVHQRM